MSMNPMMGMPPMGGGPGGPPMPPQGGPPGMGGPPQGGPPGMEGGPPPGMPPMPPPEQEVDWEALAPEEMIEDVQLSEDEEKKLVDFLESELTRSRNTLEPKMKRVAQFRERYAEYRRKKDFPWPNCSNTEVSMTAPYVNQVVGRNMRVLRSTDPPVIVEPVYHFGEGNEELKQPDMVEKIQAYVNAKMLQDPTFNQSLYEWVLESAVAGTGIAKVYWDHRERSIQKFTLEPQIDGTMKPKKVTDMVTEFQGSRLEAIKLEDFMLSPEKVNDPNGIQTALWAAHKFYTRLDEIKDKAAAGEYNKAAAEKIKVGTSDSDPVSRNSYVDEARWRNIGQVDQPTLEGAGMVTLYEFHIRWRIGKEAERELVVVYCSSSQCVLQVRNSIFFHGKRPFIRLPYWPLANDFFGRGIPEQLWNSQIAANDVLNSGLDSLTLANTGVWVMSKQGGLKPGKNDRIWAGRILTLDDPDAMRRLDTGNPSPGTMEFIEKIDHLGQRAASVSENLTGGESASGNRETAEGAMARAGSATPMFDIVLDEIRRALAEVAEMFLSNCQQFAYGSDAYGAAEEQKLKLPVLSVVGKYKFRVVASSVSANPEIRKTTLQHLMATIAPVMEQLQQKVMGLVDAPPPVQIILKKDLAATLLLARQMVQAFGLPGAENLIPTWAEFEPEIMQAVQEMQKQKEGQPPPMEESVQRKINPAFVNLEQSEAVQVLERLGLTPSPLRKKVAQDEQLSAPQPQQPGGPPPGAMGGPQPPGAPGASGPPPQMPGVPPTGPMSAGGYGGPGAPTGMGG